MARPAARSVRRAAAVLVEPRQGTRLALLQLSGAGRRRAVAGNGRGTRRQELYPSRRSQAGVGVGAAAEQASSNTATSRPAKANKKPLAVCGEGVGWWAIRMGAFPFSRRKSSTTMGPATGLPAFQRLVTVAGLCRIHTGFADPTICSSVDPRSLTPNKPLISRPRQDWRPTAIPPGHVPAGEVAIK